MSWPLRRPLPTSDDADIESHDSESRFARSPLRTHSRIFFAAMTQHSNIIGLTLQDISHWPRPNYDDPPIRGWMPIYASILYAFGTSMAATRVLMFFAWLGSTMFMVIMIVSTEKYECDRSIWNVHYDKYPGIAKMVFLLEIAFLFTQASVKVSILLLYHRLVDGKFSTAFMVAIYSGIAVTVGYSIAYLLVVTFACSPVYAWWQAFDLSYQATGDYRCLDTGTTWINVSGGVFAGGTDLYVIFLPWFMSRSLGLPKKQLFILNFVFSLGALATIASGFRTYYLYEVGSAPDISGNLFKCMVWAYLELQLGIICANAPAFRVCFRKLVVAPVKRTSFLSSLQKSQSSTHDRDHDEVALRRTSSNISTLKRPDSMELEAEIDSHLTVTETGRVVMTSTDVKDRSSVIEDEERIETVVRTPMDYEAYNMRTIEMSRQMVSARQSAQVHSPGG